MRLWTEHLNFALLRLWEYYPCSKYHELVYGGKMERLASRVKESLKFNDVPIFGSYIHFQLVKKKQGFNFHKQNTKYNGPQHFPLRSSSILMLSYSTVNNKKT